LASALAAKEVVEFPRSLPPSTSKRPNVLLIVMDTVRADHLSCYGYRRETTPNVDAFAAGARLYKNVLSPSFWTLPAHASMFTGLSSSAHGVNWLHRNLDKRFATLAEQLAAHGYQTVGLSSNPMINPSVGLNRGFQTFWNSDSFEKGLGIAPAMHTQLARWFRDRYDPSKPFFLFMNYIEAHQPYAPPQESLRFASADTWAKWHSEDQSLRGCYYTLAGRESFSSEDIAGLEALYDDEICYVDRKIGEILTFLKSTALEENTLVIIAADHGEHFGEHHLMEHQVSVYEPLVRVPLIVRYHGRFEAGKEERLVQSHDIYPTVLQLAGLECKPLPGQTCQSLLQPAAGVRLGISEHLEADTGSLGRVCFECPDVDATRFNRRLRAIQRENLKLIRSSGFDFRSEQTFELYDLANDPMETRNLADRKPAATRELAAALDAWIGSFDHYVASAVPHTAGSPTATPKEIKPMKEPTPTPKEIKAMRGLGYFHLGDHEGKQ
jgi:arylsulfatase A-like enzyme